MDGEGLEREVAALRHEIEQLNGHRFLRVYSSLTRLVWFQFLRGIAFGFGSVVGATIVVSAIVYVLSSVDFVPVVGEWAKQVIEVIQGDQGAQDM